MTDKKLPTDPYKGVRDFYPHDMAIQQYLFTVWSQSAEAFGFERYDASVLEPAELYRAKGAENEELVNEQTYTFLDRGGREVTLRPEMTPTVARMVARKHREMGFPIRWYSIPNLFRYERTQRGRLREHWQLNCDIFGTDNWAAEVEVIALAYHIFLQFGATPDMFEILINNRATMERAYEMIGITDPATVTALTRHNDRKEKMTDEAYRAGLAEITGSPALGDEVYHMVTTSDPGDNQVVAGLKALGITNVRLDRSLARGFDYYTGTIFEVKDTHPDNRRSLLGGGRYDNLTELFHDTPVSGIGFGFGDVTLRDFLETHNLLPEFTTAPQVLVIPTETEHTLIAQGVAQQLRRSGLRVATDLSTRKLAKKMSAASDSGVTYVVVVGESETTSQTFTLKHLATGQQQSGTLEELTTYLDTE